MLEQAPRQQSEQGSETLATHEIEAHKERLEREQRARLESDTSQDNQETIQRAAQAIERHALATKETEATHTNQTHQPHPVFVNKQLKDMAYSRSMTRIQKKLSVPSRLFSKAIHSTALDKPSEAIGKTVARPSGMLGGALVSAIGTSILLWTTKHYGYEYNYLAVILLFAGGLFAGLAIEAAYKLLKK